MARKLILKHDLKPHLLAEWMMGPDHRSLDAAPLSANMTKRVPKTAIKSV